MGKGWNGWKKVWQTDDDHNDDDNVKGHSLSSQQSTIVAANNNNLRLWLLIKTPENIKFQSTKKNRSSQKFLDPLCDTYKSDYSLSETTNQWFWSKDFFWKTLIFLIDLYSQHVADSKNVYFRPENVDGFHTIDQFFEI